MVPPHIDSSPAMRLHAPSPRMQYSTFSSSFWVCIPWTCSWCFFGRDTGCYTTAVNTVSLAYWYCGARFILSRFSPIRTLSLLVCFVTMCSYGGHTIPYHTIVIRTHDGPKNHVSPYVYIPYLVLIAVLALPRNSRNYLIQ